MCTVSYLPLSAGGYIVTSNRDETPSRNAVGLRHLQADGQTIVFPVDPAAGGSWIAVSDQGRIACLLNGAYEPFRPDPKYTHSRGQVLLSAVSSVDPAFDDSVLALTAPFTLVLVEDMHLREYVWDADSLHVRTLDPAIPAFWSSVTLYPEDVRKWRKSMFEHWLSTHAEYSQEDIIDFHRYGGQEDGWNGFVMNREERVRTLSITSAQRSQTHMSLCHDDLIAENTIREQMEIIPQNVATD